MTVNDPKAYSRPWTVTLSAGSRASTPSCSTITAPTTRRARSAWSASEPGPGAADACACGRSCCSRSRRASPSASPTTACSIPTRSCSTSNRRTAWCSAPAWCRGSTSYGVRSWVLPLVLAASAAAARARSGSTRRPSISRSSRPCSAPASLAVPYAAYRIGRALFADSRRMSRAPVHRLLVRARELRSSRHHRRDRRPTWRARRLALVFAAADHAR